MSRTVLVTATNYSAYCAEAKKLLEDNGFQVVENRFSRPLTPEELKAAAAEADAAVAGVDAWNEEIFSAAPKLKILARFGVGIDNIDLAAAKRRGVLVTNAKGGNSAAVADQAVALMLCMLRNIPHLDASVRAGGWERFVGFGMEGKQVGLLGFGNIARLVAKRLSGFGVTVRAWDKYPDAAAAEKLSVELCSMDEVLSRSDIVSLHLPNLPETRRIMNRETFARMKEGAFFVNTARGALVDEAALAEALRSGHLRMAAADVYEKEPVPPDDPLLACGGVILTPHTCGDTFETYRSVGLTTARAILDFFGGKTPLNLC